MSVFRRYSQAGGAVHDLEHIAGLSAERTIPLLLSERALYVLQNLANQDVAFECRWAVERQQAGYLRLTTDDAEYSTFVDVVSEIGYQLREVQAVWETGDLRFMAADASLGEGPPFAWLYCDGSQVPVEDYPDLYDRIGDTWGSADEGNFRLPDFRGRSPQGYDSADGVGDLVGAQYQTSVPSHAHEMGSATAETGAGPYVQRTTTFGANISTNAFGVGSPGVDQRGPRATVVVWIKT